MPRFPSDEWFAEYVRRINASPEYRETAATWEGAIAFVIGAEPDRGIREDVWAWLDLWHGGCRRGGLVPREEGELAPYVISAPYSRWKQVLRGDLDPIKGMIQGKLKVKGDLAMIIRYVRAANELTLLTQTVPTEFPDEA